MKNKHDLWKEEAATFPNNLTLSQHEINGYLIEFIYWMKDVESLEFCKELSERRGEFIPMNEDWVRLRYFQYLKSKEDV